MIYKNLRLLQFMVQQVYFLERQNLPPGVNLPQVKNHWTSA